MPDPTPPVVIPEPAPAAPVSPTGTPLVPAKLVPYFGLGFSICTAVAGASQLGLGLPTQVFGWAAIGALVFAAALGLTPGARK